MTDIIEVITTESLQDYLGSRWKGGDLANLVGLVNGLINEKWRTPTDPAPSSVEVVAFAVADRAYDNPRGYSSRTRTITDGSRTERLPEKYARAGVFLTEEEMKELRAAKPAGRRRSRFGTLRVDRGW